VTGADATEPADLGAWLRTGWLGRSSTFHEEIPSTQDEAVRLAAGGVPHGYLVWAGAQSAGRGRLHREWQSPALSGLWFSVVLRPEVTASRVAALPLAMGAAVGSDLAALAPGRVRLKWPNDVLLDGRKLAGILVDAHVAGGRMEHAVVGVGINLSRPEAGFQGEVAATAATLAEVTGAAPPAARTLAGVLLGMERAYDDLLAHGPGNARANWLELGDTIGRDVVARVGGATREGRAVDLDEDGNLVLLVDGAAVTIAYGEIEQLR
jgi:BirA family biotin operon repressor/biotin-[acetyl-CoA-carboxylase] ligase